MSDSVSRRTTSAGIYVDEIAEALWPNTGRTASECHTRAPVSSVNGGVVNVLLRGAETPTPCSKLTSCAVKAGDLALVLMTPSGGIVLGTIG